MVDGSVSDCNGKVSVVIREQGQKIDFTPTPGGWDLDDDVESHQREPIKCGTKKFTKSVQRKGQL